MFSIFDTLSLLSEKQNDGLDKNYEKQKDPNIKDSEKTLDTKNNNNDTDNIEDPEMPEDTGMEDSDDDNNNNDQDTTDDTSIEDNTDDEIEGSEDDTDINKKKKLLEAYKKLYNDTEELINQISNTLSSCNDIEYKALQTTIDNLYKIKEILYNYIINHYNKSEYNENLYYYISSVKCIKITKKILYKILEIRNKH